MTVPFPVIPANYDQVTPDMARNLIPVNPDTEKNRPFVEGDHFQHGAGWRGPGPKPHQAGYNEFLLLLEPAFISANVIEEICDRVVSAVVGRVPYYDWVPLRPDVEEKPMTDQEKSAIADLQVDLRWWWEQRDCYNYMKKLLKQIMWAKASCWRLYVPQGLLSADGTLSVSNFRDALSKIYVEIPDPSFATVFEHPDTRARLGVVAYRTNKNVQEVEMTYLDGAKTIIRVGDQRVALDFGQHLPVFQVQLDKARITPQLRSLQRALNMTLTLMNKGIKDNHFLERFFTNTMPPGKWEMEADGVTRKRFIPDARATGDNVDSYLQGIDYKDEKGTTQVKDPTVVIRDPLDPRTTISGAEFWYQKMLEESKQEHVLINQAATPTGRSREQARGDFADSTLDPEDQTVRAQTELIVTLVSMAETFSGQTGKWTSKFKPIVKCRPNYGPLTVEERTQNVVEAEKGFIAVETAMSRNGVDDIEAEESQIIQQPRAELELSAKRADVTNAWSDVFPREVALYLAGFSDKEIKEIMSRVADAMANDVAAPPPLPAPGAAAPTGVVPPVVAPAVTGKPALVQ